MFTYKIREHLVTPLVRRQWLEEHRGSADFACVLKGQEAMSFGCLETGETWYKEH